MNQTQIVHFLFKRESKCLPSQVPKADTHRSPLKLSRSTRNLVKCGYSSQSQAHVHPADSFNPFDSYAIQNIGTLEAFVNICCCHTRDTGCTGNFRFISPQSNFMYKSFSGTLFSVHTIECSTCGSTFVLESDYFESKPSTDKSTHYSRVSQLAGIASKNMSWVFTEMQMLFSVIGVAFFTPKNFQYLRNHQGAQIIKLTEEVVAANLQREIEMVKCGKGLPQGVVNKKVVAYTKEEIGNMRSDQLKAVLDEIGFPGLSKKEERLEALNLLLFEPEEEKLKLFAEKYGNTQMWRLDVGGDGSWAFRSYNNNVKSAFGQAALIGACTKSVIAWGHRILKCHICSRAENARKVPKEHVCQINHQGSVKSMESEIILECFQKLLTDNCVVGQIALDGDSTTLSLLQKTLINDIAYRMFGGEVIVDMKADDRHLNKTIKDRVYNAMNANTRLRKGAPKVKPLKEPQDCYKLGRLPSLLRAQLQADSTIEFGEKVKMFQLRLKNAVTHYFNDDKGKHVSCMKCGFLECEVVQAQLHNCLAMFSRAAHAKGVRMPMKCMRLVGEMVGYYGIKSNLRVCEVLDMNAVKPKLADGLWLGERCVGHEQLQRFRRDMESIYEELAQLKTAKKIIRSNNTQINEALHGIQSRIFRKDVNHGDSIEYVYAMAAGVLKLSLGECYLPTLAARLGCKLPSAAINFLERKHNLLTNKNIYKLSIGGKRKRAAACVALKRKIQPGSVVDEVTPGVYVSSGKGLLLAMSEPASDK